MSHFLIALVLVIVNLWSCSANLKHGINLTLSVDDGKVPKQIHLSLGADSSKMIVTWSTLLSTPESMVRYGIGTFTTTRLGNITKFMTGKDTFQYIHTALMDELIPNSTYIYQVGSGNPGEMSAILQFKTAPLGVNWSPRFCVYGDMGLENAQSLSRIKDDISHGMYDVIMHVGDFAYDMHSNSGEVGDKFLQLIEPIASRIPYMTTPGNHEQSGNFSNYKKRFLMPNNNNENMFYSYNVGPVHVVSISTEFYVYLNYGIAQLSNQYQWLIADLKTANLPNNRKNQPWILFLGHRPIYCTNNGSIDCTTIAYWLRYGIPVSHHFGLERLLYQYGVDLAMWAHEHSYERMWPVYKERVVNSSTVGQPYNNPKATVHIVSGSAGCKERHAYFKRQTKPYSAFHSTDYGYSRITVKNQTHLYLEQVSDDQVRQYVTASHVAYCS